MLRASLHHGSHDAIREFTVEQWRTFMANWPGFSVADRRLWRDSVNVHFYDNSTQRITMDEGVALEQLGLLLDIEGLDGTMLTKMQGKPRMYQWNDFNGKQVRDILEGSVVNIAIPDLALLQITKVTWLDDSCTEELQAKLDEGWRILAVCPPNSQRRPDYILGWCGKGDPE